MLQKMSACSDNSSNTWRAPKLACSRDIELSMARLGVEASGGRRILTLGIQNFVKEVATYN
jgi:hypothetical protein